MGLRIYSDQALVPAARSHVVMLSPFWGKNPENPADPSTGRFDRYVEVGSQLFELVPLEIADLAIFPSEWSPSLEQAVESFVADAKETGKPTAVFVGGDEYRQLRYEDALVFQASLYRSRRQPNEFALPAWSEDFVTAHLGGRLPVRSRLARPVVGFCGLAPQTRGLRARLRAHPAHTSIRAKALRLLWDHAGVDTNFVERQRFLGGAISRGQLDPAAIRRVRDEYVSNMVESDYILCSRGAGNFSYRLYETLSCGRIPIFVDTDSVLPYDFAVDWRDYCLWIPESELESIGDQVVAFHENLDEQGFEDLQRECRRFWEEYLAPEGFFGRFHEHLARVQK